MGNKLSTINTQKKPEKSVEKKVIKGEAVRRKNTKFLVNKTSFGSWQQ